MAGKRMVEFRELVRSVRRATGARKSDAVGYHFAVPPVLADRFHEPGRLWTVEVVGDSPRIAVIFRQTPHFKPGKGQAF